MLTLRTLRQCTHAVNTYFFICLSAKHPKQKEDAAKAGVKHDFQVAPDGRLIISEDKDEQEAKTKGEESS